MDDLVMRRRGVVDAMMMAGRVDRGRLKEALIHTEMYPLPLPGVDAGRGNWMP